MTGTVPELPPVPARRLPPVAELTVASLALMLAGGVDLAAHLPRHPPLGPVVGLLVGGAVLTAVALTLLSRISPFAWRTFFLVARWSLLAYAVITGVGVFVFLYDHTGGSTLVVLILSLVVFAIDVPTVIAFTAARYEDTGGLPGGQGRPG